MSNDGKKSSFNKKWMKVSAPCPDAITEPVADLLSRLSGAGVEINPDGQGASKVTGYFPLDLKEDNSGKNIHDTLQTLKKEVIGQLETIFLYLDHSFVHPVFDIIEEEDWSNTWKEFFTPFEIVEGLVVTPSWEKYVPENGQLVMELDPGMAFGTGQHASTQYALSLMQYFFKEQSGHTVEEVLDVGTGTGILAMAAALFGARRVVALDNDPDAVEACLENVKVNKLENTVEVSGTDVEQLTGSYDLICANIVHDVLVPMAPVFKKLSRKSGCIILAGILHGEQEESIISVYTEMGMRVLKAQYKDEWVALLLEWEK
jgi:ribosomal protein L11 methyltransferase